MSEATGPYLHPLPDLFLAPTAHRLGSGSRWRDALSGFQFFEHRFRCATQARSAAQSRTHSSMSQ
jgi:hypothetical protein